MKKLSNKWLKKNGWYNIIDYWFWNCVIAELALLKNPYFKVKKGKPE